MTAALTGRVYLVYHILFNLNHNLIHRAPPEQYVSVVPNLVPAPKETDDEEDEEDFLQSVTEVFGEFSTDFSDSGAISFGVAPRRRVSGLRPRHGEEDMVFRSLFWCATDVDTSGYVKEWGKCNVGCKADPAGSYVPAAPRRGTSTSRGFNHSLRGQTVGQLAAIIRAANQRTRPRGPN